jgi:hypothetical protein
MNSEVIYIEFTEYIDILLNEITLGDNLFVNFYIRKTELFKSFILQVLHNLYLIWHISKAI